MRHAVPIVIAFIVGVVLTISIHYARHLSVFHQPRKGASCRVQLRSDAAGSGIVEVVDGTPTLYGSLQTMDSEWIVVANFKRPNQVVWIPRPMVVAIVIEPDT